MDDRLPCLAGRLCFSRCQREDVFWLPLLEKVYAKYASRRGWAGRAGGWGSRTAAPLWALRASRVGWPIQRPQL